MSEPTTKQKAIQAIEGMADDATNEDVMERLLFLSKVDQGLADIEEGRVVEHEVIKRRWM